MPMESLEFKELLIAFEEDVADVRDDLYEALTDELPAARRKAIIAAAKKKLADYDAMLGKLQGLQRKQAADEFQENVGIIKERLAKLIEP
jgi:hypothetical protein